MQLYIFFLLIYLSKNVDLSPVDLIFYGISLWQNIILKLNQEASCSNLRFVYFKAWKSSWFFSIWTLNRSSWLDLFRYEIDIFQYSCFLKKAFLEAKIKILFMEVNMISKGYSPRKILFVLKLMVGFYLLIKE